MGRKSYADQATSSAEHFNVCSYPDCGRRAREAELCWGHAKMKRRNGKLSPLNEKQEPMDKLRKAAQTWVNAESEDDFRNADRQLWRAALGVRDAHKSRG